MWGKESTSIGLVSDIERCSELRYWNWYQERNSWIRASLISIFIRCILKYFKKLRQYTRYTKSYTNFTPWHHGKGLVKPCSGCCVKSVELSAMLKHKLIMRGINGRKRGFLKLFADFLSVSPSLLPPHFFPALTFPPVMG